MNPTTTTTNTRGNRLDSWGVYTTRAESRYHFDFGDGFAELNLPTGKGKGGWEQYDTDQDANYFGVWVNTSTRQVLTYAEGDIDLVTCHTIETFRAELASMAEFYGDPPPAFISIDYLSVNSGDQGGEVTVTHHYGTRPGGDA